MKHKITLDRYLDRLAARSPAPGGGSAAALVGALGVSLLSMIAKYTIKRTGRRASYMKLSKILKFAESSRFRLKRLMSKDEAAYSRLSKALKEGNVKNITKLYKDATEVPLEICGILREALAKCKEMCGYCSKSLISDLAEAAILLEAGFLSAKCNVDVNLRDIGSGRYAGKTRDLLSKQKTTVRKTKNGILKKALG